ncbi:MAG TPA: gamma-glutamyltransferase [Streptosporangiaceae bacterium]|jgi:gamma-glutamyltranspeptidase/glutathione hydrolase|nr:gamma-glutamyltransferase [Streptosporangiaceae bacterium]
MRRLSAICVTSAVAIAVSVLPSLASASTPSAPARAGGAATPDAVKEPVAVGTGGAAASMSLGASKAAIKVLKAGGNAVDAAVAAASTMGVTIPFVAGPGGGGFMVIYLARSHKVITIDGRENCPQACTSTMFLNPKTGQPRDYFYASDQPLSTGVPSMVATWAKAVKRYGANSLATDLQPAIQQGEQGFRVNADFRQLEQSDLPELRAYTASRQLLLTKSGGVLPAGYLLRNPDLAHTYQLLAKYGPSYLYNGPIGQAVVAADDHPATYPGQKVVHLDGIMKMSDLRHYQAYVRAPTHVKYQGLDVYSMAPPSSSGTTVGEALNILNGYDLKAEPRAEALFHYLEASRLSYADRDAYVGDPRYVGVPVKSLLDPKFAATRRCLIHNTALTSPVAPGDPTPPYQKCQTSSTPAPTVNEGMHTNNIVTTDKWGDIVTYTNTINFFGGSGQVVPGYGFLLNDEMTDFDFAPPAPGAYDPNLPAGGKQPRSSMGGAIVLRDGKPDFTVGAAGGSTIITTILQIILNHVDFGMSLPQALAASRVSQTNSPTSLAEPKFYNSAMAHQLTQQYNEQFSLATGPILPLDYYPGDATGLQFLGHGLLQAVAEPARLYGGSALVVNPSK